MSTQGPESFAAQVEAIRLRIEKISSDIASDVRRHERRRKLALGAGAALATVCLVSLSSLTWRMFQLDAEALTQIGRYHLEASLPESREATQEYLKSLAPEVTANFLAAAIGSIPQFRPLVLSELEDRLSTFSAEFETRLAALADSAVSAARADLEEHQPNSTDAEQIQFVVAAVADRFTENVRTLFGELYPEYASELRRVEEYILRLRNTDPSRLSQRERTEREIIETLLKLMAREGPGSVRG